MKTWCAKCRKFVIVINGKLRYMRNGKPQEIAECKECGTKTYRLLSREEQCYLKQLGRIDD